MKNLSICLFFLIAVFIFSGTAFAQESEFRAGVATIDITPPVGVPLAGYGGGARRLFPPDLDPDNYHTFLTPSEGVMDPLIAKAVVLQNGSEKIAIIKLDSIGVTQNIVSDLAKRIEKETGIDADHITISGTHTHSGPGAMTTHLFWQVAAVDLFESKVYDPLLDKIGQMVIEANNNLQPARLGINTGLSFDLSKNRRKKPGVKDPTVAVFKIEKLDGTPMALMFNFAIHGTCYGADNLHFSGDVMGYAEQNIERMMAEQKTPAVAMFINGSEGDVAPAQGKSKGAKAVGHGLARKVLEILPTISMRQDVKIAVANETIRFKKAHLNLSLAKKVFEEDEPEIDCWGIRNVIRKLAPKNKDGDVWQIEVTGIVPMSFRLQALRIGDTVIACVPGEPITNVGNGIKAKGKDLGFNNSFIFSLSNGHMGYITDKENFDEGKYEAMLTLYGRDQFEKMTAVYARLFQQLSDK